MDDVVASEGDALRLIQMMGNYLVALVARFIVCDTNGTPIGMEILPISGFMTQIGKRRFWVTAGHCLRDCLDKKLTDSAYKLESMSFMDCFGEHRTRIAALPMEYQPGDGWAVHEPDSAIDFALLPITDGQWEKMKQNGIQTINPATWKDLPEQSFEYKVVGFPGERVVRMEELDTWGLRTTGISVNRLRPEDVGYGSPDWFAGELKVDASQVKSVKGMSGGPIFAFWKDEEKRIFCHVIAVQSWWQPFERLIFGCKMGFFFECMRKRFAEKPSADASDSRLRDQHAKATGPMDRSLNEHESHEAEVNMDETSDEFVITLPVFSYLIEPGPHPGFLKDPKTKITYVPLWTDEDLFDRYLTGSGLAGKVSGLYMNSVPELVTFLKSIPEQIRDVMIDPAATAPMRASTWTIARMLEELEKA